jgi:hypothetical protein
MGTWRVYASFRSSYYLIIIIAIKRQLGGAYSALLWEIVKCTVWLVMMLHTVLRLEIAFGQLISFSTALSAFWSVFVLVMQFSAWEVI